MCGWYDSISRSLFLSETRRGETFKLSSSDVLENMLSPSHELLFENVDRL